MLITAKVTKAPVRGGNYWGAIEAVANFPPYSLKQAVQKSNVG